MGRSSAEMPHSAPSRETGFGRRLQGAPRSALISFVLPAYGLAPSRTTRAPLRSGVLPLPLLERPALPLCPSPNRAQHAGCRAPPPDGPSTLLDPGLLAPALQFLPMPGSAAPA